MKVIVSRHHRNLGNYNGFLVIKAFGLTICYIKNGLIHNKKGPAVKRFTAGIGWYYKGKWYGNDDTFTIKSWKRQMCVQKLEIFK